jgi:predicted transcriptional regulator
MPVTKQKFSVTLDDDLVAELRLAPDALSSQINDAVRHEVERRRRHHALEQFLAELDAADGPLASPEDELAIAHYMRLLGGLA